MAEKTPFNAILSVSGKPGLFKVYSRSKSVVIVESLEDGKRMPVYSSSKVISLSDITMYTKSDDKPLREILMEVEKLEHGGPSVAASVSEQEHRAKMAQAVPDYDAERVYASDLKKLFMWYNILQKSGNLPGAEEPVEEKAE